MRRRQNLRAWPELLEWSYRLSGIVRCIWNPHAVRHLRVGPHHREAIEVVNPKTLNTAWYRQFSGAMEIARGVRSILILL